MPIKMIIQKIRNNCNLRTFSYLSEIHQLETWKLENNKIVFSYAGQKLKYRLSDIAAEPYAPGPARVLFQKLSEKIGGGWFPASSRNTNNQRGLHLKKKRDIA